MKPVMVFFVTLAIFAIVLGMIVLFQVDRFAFWTSIAALMLFGIYIGVTSTYVIGPNDMIASYFQGTWRITYVNRKYGRRLTEDLAARRLRPDQVAGSRYGHTRDLVALLWFFRLLWQGLRFPTTAIKLPVRAGRVLTARGRTKHGDDDARSPRIRLRADTTLILRLSPNVAAVVETFDILHKEVGWDLTRKEPMEDKTGRTILAPCIAKTLLETAQETILEAVRVASSRYSWGGTKDIVSNKTELEKDVLRILSEPESLFVQAQILREIPKGWENLPAGQPKPEPQAGPAAISVDFNIEEIAPDPIPEGASDLEKAIDKPLIAVLEAEATIRRAEAEKERERLVREGRAQGLRAIAEALGVTEDKAEIFRGEVIEKATSNTSFNVFGEGFTSLVRTLFGRGTPPR